MFNFHSFNTKTAVLASFIAIFTLAACQNGVKKAAITEIYSKTGMKVPDWAKSATIYEVNVRQFSKEGTFAKVTDALPDIKALGVDILWVMPIFPISEKNRKCNEKEKTECWGSHYAATSFTEVSPRYGTNADFAAFVKKAHSLGLKVILDFVPDHTGWDSKWIAEHPEYYVKVNGKISTPIDPVTKVPTDWNDVAMLDYTNKGLRKAMIEAHKYWIEKFDIDGYREDVAGFVRDDFWAELRPELDKLKPVFMLSEWGDNPEHLKTCFQMNYGWTFHALIKDIASGKRNANDLDLYLKEFKPKFPKEGYQMQFTQNHDENSWNGTEKQSFGEAGNTFTALCFTFDGMGEIYNGQEVSLNKRLSFFHKDEIDWSGVSRRAFFKTLTTLKHENKALWNGMAGGEVQRIPTTDTKNVYAFMREKDNNRVVCIYNLSPTATDVVLQGSGFIGDYKNVMQSGAKTSLTIEQKLRLAPWEYLILTK